MKKIKKVIYAKDLSKGDVLAKKELRLVAIEVLSVQPVKSERHPDEVEVTVRLHFGERHGDVALNFTYPQEITLNIDAEQSVKVWDDKLAALAATAGIGKTQAVEAALSAYDDKVSK